MVVRKNHGKIAHHHAIIDTLLLLEESWSVTTDVVYKMFDPVADFSSQRSFHIVSNISLLRSADSKYVIVGSDIVPRWTDSLLLDKYHLSFVSLILRAYPKP